MTRTQLSFPVAVEVVEGALDVHIHDHVVPIGPADSIPCWSYVTSGLWAHGQAEIALTLRRWGESLGYTREFSIHDTEDKNALIKRMLKERGVDDIRPAEVSKGSQSEMIPKNSSSSTARAFMAR